MIKLERNSDFEIVRFSDSRYGKLIAEIRYMGEPVAQINKIKGLMILSSKYLQI